MPDEIPIETPPVETPPVETPPAAPPVETPPVEDEPAPVFSWDFPPATPVEPPPARTPEEEDEYATKLQQGAVMTSVQMNTAIQGNFTKMMSNLQRNNATDEVLMKAQEEFWKFGVGAANPESIQFATKLALGAVAMEGKPTTKPRARVTPPGAAPVGNIPQPVGGKNAESAALAKDVFNAAMEAEGLDIVFTDEDFAGVE